MRKLFPLIILLLSTIAFAQEPKKVDASKPPVPIAITQEMKDAVDGADRVIEMAQLKKTNLILRLRLILKVPNDYEWSDEKHSFFPPAVSEKPPAAPKDK